MKRFAFIFGAWCAMLFASTSASAHSIIGNLILTPDALSFPNTRPGETSATQTITVTKSPSFLPVNIYSVTLADETNFTLVNDGCSGQTLFNHSSCDLDFTFNPDAVGSFSSSVVIIDSTLQIANFGSLSGQGVAPQVSLSRSDIDFGDQFINESSTQPVTVTNIGTDVLNISDISVTSGAPEFSMTNDCPAALNPDESCVLQVTFAPTVAGDFTGQVTLTDDASDSPQQIPLSGTAIASGPDADLFPSDIDFPLTVVNTESAGEIVTLENDGDSPLNVSGVTVTSNFLLGNGGTCDTANPFALAPDASCTFEVIFAPNTTGPLSGTLTVNDDASDGAQTVFLSGTGIDPGSATASLSANSLDFGEQDIETSATQSITVTNTGNEPLTFESIVLGGNDAFAYSVTDDCSGSDLLPEETCTLTVEFFPLVDGTFDATLTLTSNADDSPQVVTLTGVGIGNGNIGGGGCALGGNPTPTGPILSFVVLGLLGLGVRLWKRAH